MKRALLSLAVLLQIAACGRLTGYNLKSTVEQDLRSKDTTVGASVDAHFELPR